MLVTIQPESPFTLLIKVSIGRYACNQGAAFDDIIQRAAYSNQGANGTR